jgi:hypothetical protein
MRSIYSFDRVSLLDDALLAEDEDTLPTLTEAPEPDDEEQAVA